MKNEVRGFDEIRKGNGRVEIPAEDFLVAEDSGSEYITCLLFDDADSCEKVADYLMESRGMSLPAIGDSDVTHLPIDNVVAQRTSWTHNQPRRQV